MAGLSSSLLLRRTTTTTTTTTSSLPLHCILTSHPRNSHLQLPRFRSSSSHSLRHGARRFPSFLWTRRASFRASGKAPYHLYLSPLFIASNNSSEKFLWLQLRPVRIYLQWSSGRISISQAKSASIIGNKPLSLSLVLSPMDELKSMPPEECKYRFDLK